MCVYKQATSIQELLGRVEIDLYLINLQYKCTKDDKSTECMMVNRETRIASDKCQAVTNCECVCAGRQPTHFKDIHKRRFSSIR